MKRINVSPIKLFLSVAFVALAFSHANIYVLVAHADDFSTDQATPATVDISANVPADTSVLPDTSDISTTSTITSTDTVASSSEVSQAENQATDDVSSLSVSSVRASFVGYDPGRPSIFGIPPTDLYKDAGGVFGVNFSYIPLYQIEWYDGTGGPFPIACDPASGSIFPGGMTTVVTCTATDTHYPPNTETVTASFNVVVNLVSMPVSLSPTSLATGTVGMAYQRTGWKQHKRPVVIYMSTSALGPFSFEISSGSLPTGLSLSVSADGRSAVISGTSTTAGTYPFTVTATNGTSSTTQSYSISIYDNTPPVISGMPSDITVEAASSTGSIVTFTNPTAIDDVDPSVTPVCAPSSGSTFSLGTTTVKCSAADSSGNVSSSTFSVTVQDTIPPVITLNGSSTTDLNVGDTYAEQGATAYDAVDGTTTATVGGDTVNASVAGIYNVTYDAVDAAGNHAVQAMRTVDVITAPVVTPPPSQTVSQSSSGSYYRGFSMVPLASSAASPVSPAFASSPTGASANANPNANAGQGSVDNGAGASTNAAPASPTANPSPTSNVPTPGASQVAAVGALGSNNSIYLYIIATLAVIAGIGYLVWNRVRIKQ